MVKAAKDEPDGIFAYDEDAGEQRNIAMALYAIANAIVYSADKLVGVPGAKDESGLAALTSAIADGSVELGRVADALDVEEEESE